MRTEDVTTRVTKGGGGEGQKEGHAKKASANAGSQFVTVRRLG